MEKKTASSCGLLVIKILVVCMYQFRKNSKHFPLFMRFFFPLTTWFSMSIMHMGWFYTSNPLARWRKTVALNTMVRHILMTRWYSRMLLVPFYIISTRTECFFPFFYMHLPFLGLLYFSFFLYLCLLTLVFTMFLIFEDSTDAVNMVILCVAHFQATATHIWVSTILKQTPLWLLPHRTWLVYKMYHLVHE